MRLSRLQGTAVRLSKKNGPQADNETRRRILELYGSMNKKVWSKIDSIKMPLARALSEIYECTWIMDKGNILTLVFA